METFDVEEYMRYLKSLYCDRILCTRRETMPALYSVDICFPSPLRVLLFAFYVLRIVLCLLASKSVTTFFPAN